MDGTQMDAVILCFYYFTTVLPLIHSSEYGKYNIHLSLSELRCGQRYEWVF